MAVQLTNDQFEQMLTRLLRARQKGAGGQAQVGGGESNAAVIGPMHPCILGVDKTRWLKTFEDWLRECQVKMDFMNITNEGRKIALIRSWAGPDLTNFWDREARINWATIQGQDGNAETPADTFHQIIEKTKTEIRKHINKDRALIELLSTKQEGDNWMLFIKRLEEQADLCDLETNPLSRKEAIKIAALA